MVAQVSVSLSLLVLIFFAAFNLETHELGLASNLNALMIVLVGTLATTLMAYPWKKLIWTFLLVKKTFTLQEEIDWTTRTLVSLSRLSVSFLPLLPYSYR